MKSSSVYQFLDFRDFLKERILQLRKERWYSERAFARRARFSSPSFLKMVLDGKRNLSPESAQRVAKILGLNSNETRFFVLLVRLSLVKSEGERGEIFASLSEFKKFAEIRRIELDQLTYFSNWKWVALREALATPFWQAQSLEVLAKAVDSSVREVEVIISGLERLGFVERTEAGGYLAKQEALQTPRQMRSLVVRNFHQEMLSKAQDSLCSVDLSKRDVGGLTIALSEEDFRELKEALFNFQSRVNTKYSGSKSARNIYQFNFQIFPLILERRS
jgi:uncharacterized protein (TIGR02147 family)